MSIEITTVMVTVAIEPPTDGRKTFRSGSPAIELLDSYCRVWDDVQCGEIYRYADVKNKWVDGPVATEMPNFDAVFRYLTEQYAQHRKNPLGDFLEPIVSSLETSLAAKQGSSVYFAEADGRVKIGWSRQVATRVAQLQTGNATPIKLLGVISGGRVRERQIHDLFANARVGGEWFTATPELLAFIREEVRVSA